MTLYLGVDIGTTRTKVGCVDGDTGLLVAVAAAPTPVHDDALGGTRDAGALIETVQGLLDEVLDHPEVQVGRLGGLAVGSVGEEVVLLDADGAVTGPVLAWHAEHGRTARRWVTDPALSPLDDTFSVFKLAWLARERPEELARAVTFTSLADHVALTLVGDGADGAFLNVSLLADRPARPRLHLAACRPAGRCRRRTPASATSGPERHDRRHVASGRAPCGRAARGDGRARPLVRRVRRRRAAGRGRLRVGRHVGGAGHADRPAAGRPPARRRRRRLRVG
ncbi:hypothetical protein ASF37_05650 [Aeromicrobium sp. Leaf289]|nr:hypothetical protein ASF37_05650 [Aeromicrobium sp. Leaf289]